VRRPPDNDADKAPGVLAGRRRLGHATTSDPGPLLSLLQASSTDPSDLLTSPPWSARPRQHVDWPRHYCVTTASSFCQSPITASFVERGIKTGAGYAATRLMEKILHTQPVPRSWMAQQFAGAGLKIATDIAGMPGRSFLLARGEINSGRRGIWSS
jgi:hypothetical protein